MKKETKAIHTPFQKRDAYGALSFPVYNTVAYEFDSAHAMTEAFAGRVPEPDYSRVMNPTVTYFENRVKALSDAENVFALTTGMAAIFHTLLVFAEAGKTIVMSNHLFGNTFSLITTTLARLGVKAQIADFSDLDFLDKTMADDACLIFAEYITNPQLEMVDIKKLSEIAHKRSLPLIVDTTAIPFTEVDARELGIDVEVLSSTKYISGGATSLGGLILDYSTFPEVKRRMSMEFLFNIGSYMTPQVAYMQTIGLETLKVRYDKQAQNALDLARLLQQVPQVKRVNYPGLQLQKPFGAMLTIDLETEQKCYGFLNSLRLIRRATNLFDSKSLAIHPYSTIFVSFTPEEKKKMDVLDTTIRLSMGLEDVNDLYEDIVQALGQ